MNLEITFEGLRYHFDVTRASVRAGQKQQRRLVATPVFWAPRLFFGGCLVAILDQTP